MKEDQIVGVKPLAETQASKEKSLVNNDNGHANSEAPQWAPGFLKRFPWIGAGALIISVACMISSIVVIKISDGQPVADWNVQPTVYLAIFSAILGLALQAAHAQGAIIAWWCSALRGCTIGDLHRNWAFGGGVWDAVTAGCRINPVAIATLLVAATAVSGPLLQKASSVTSSIAVTNITLQALIAPEIPRGYTGLGDWASRGFVRQNCSTYAIPLNMSGASLAVFNDNGTRYPSFNVSLLWKSGLPGMPTISIRQTQITPDNFEFINFTIGIANTVDCIGNFVVQSCALVPAILEYPIRLENNTVTFNTTLSNLSTVVLANNTADSSQVQVQTLNHRYTISGVARAAADLFTTSTVITAENGDLQFSGLTIFGEQYVNGTSVGCQHTWEDPTDDILAALNEIMFRTSLYAPTAVQPGATPQYDYNPNQTFLATQLKTQNVFRSNFPALYAAIAVLSLGIVSVLPTLYGWWGLSRPVSLSPLETAKAFQCTTITGTKF
ncbi:hypothetical protein N431DRAFT_446700 [Stipitochalara longipes BDJ]|nr:hypothetical protein N431DRAFT_446700 [Stipitochalara longipes BDJ]